MECQTLDLTILSADDLNQVNLFSKMDVYVVVSILDSANHRRMSNFPKQKTPVDKNGNKNPTWNFPLKFTINYIAAQQNRLSILFEIFCRRQFPGDKLVGEVHVPVSELLSTGAGNRNSGSFVSYQVRKPSGKPKGVLNFSYKFGERVTSSPPSAPPYEGVNPGQVKPGPGFHEPRPSTGYPIPGYAYPVVGPTSYGYGYGYGYGPYVQNQNPPRKNNNNFGMGGMGAGLLGGVLGGLLIGNLVSGGGFNGGFMGGF